MCSIRFSWGGRERGEPVRYRRERGFGLPEQTILRAILFCTHRIGRVALADLAELRLRLRKRNKAAEPCPGDDSRADQPGLVTASDDHRALADIGLDLAPGPIGCATTAEPDL